jgi:hypothetical protein
MELEDEASWLRRRVIRMRAALRFTAKPEVKAILREVISDAETRISLLEAPRRATADKH